MNISTDILWALGILALGVCFEVMRITWYLVSTKRLVNVAQKFEQRNLSAALRILFIGDSVGCSTGASHERYSIPGRLGADFPDAHIENLSEGKMRLSRAVRLLQEVCAKKSAPFDIVILLVGGMNIVACTPLWLVRRTLEKAVALSKECGRTMVLIGPNNTGGVPLYRFPVSNFYALRAREFDILYRNIAKENGVQYVSLFEEHEEVSSGRYVFSPDKTHPNDEGYGIWYTKIKEIITAALEKL